MVYALRTYFSLFGFQPIHGSIFCNEHDWNGHAESLGADFFLYLTLFAPFMATGGPFL
jgi:hypothetical protein